jgi:hypothetical protein
MCASGVFTHTYCSCCVLILTSKDEYTNINTTKKVIAAPENGDNIYNPNLGRIYHTFRMVAII